MLQIPYSKSEIMHLNFPKWDFNIPPYSQFKICQSISGLQEPHISYIQSYCISHPLVDRKEKPLFQNYFPF